MQDRLLITLLAAALAVGLAMSGTCEAAPLDRREVQARKDFAAGRYERAADTFAELFAVTSDPIYLRNLGRCYQKLERPREAINAFQDYLRRAKTLTSAERDEIQGFIKEMQDLEAASAPPAAPPPSAPARDREPPPPAVSVQSHADPAGDTRGSSAVTIQTPVVMIQTSPQDLEEHRHALRVAGLATASGGVVLIGAGIAFGIAARSAGVAVSKFYDPNRDSAGKRDAVLQWVGYGVGVVAAVTGALLYVAGHHPSEASGATASRTWHLGPTLGVGSGGLAIDGGF
jgi:hypothetical protein